MIDSKKMNRDCLGWWRMITLVGCAGLLIGALSQSTKDALKVRHILRTIATQPARDDTQERLAEITERELNAYIAYRLSQDKASLCSRLTVDLLDYNRISGRIRFDARRLQVDTLLGENLDFDFKGIVVTRNGTARLDLIALELNGQPVKPQVLDFVIHTAALVYRTESSGISDWYELPKGIKRIGIEPDKAILYY